MFKEVLKGSFIYSVGSNFPRFISFFLLPIFTNHLSPFDFGIWALFVSITSFLGAFRDLGLTQILVNSFFNDEVNDTWKQKWGKIFGILIIWTLFYFLISVILVTIFLNTLNLFLKIQIIILIGIQICFFDLPILFGTRILQFCNNAKAIATITAISGTLGLIVNYISIVFFEKGFLGLFYGNFIMSLISGIFYFFIVIKRYSIRPKFKFSTNEIIHDLKVSLPLIPHSLSTYFLNISDRTIMKFYNINISNIGLYNVAYTFGNYFETIGGSLGMAIQPIYTKLNKSNNQSKIRSLTFFLQYIFLNVTFLFSLWSKEIFDLMLSKQEYKEMYTISIFLIMAYSYKPMYLDCINKLGYYELTNKTFKISFVASILNVIFNLLLIPLIGFKVAAITTYISLLYMGYSGYFIKEIKMINTAKYFPIQWLLITIVLTFLAYVFRDADIGIKTSITTFFVLIFFYIIYWINRKKILS